MTINGIMMQIKLSIYIKLCKKLQSLSKEERAVMNNQFPERSNKT